MIGDFLTGLLALAVALLAVSAWFTAVKYDWRRNEPLLVVAWVACPPCGVVRGGYAYFVN